MANTVINLDKVSARYGAITPQLIDQILDVHPDTTHMTYKGKSYDVENSEQMEDMMIAWEENEFGTMHAPHE